MFLSYSISPFYLLLPSVFFFGSKSPLYCTVYLSPISVVLYLLLLFYNPILFYFPILYLSSILFQCPLLTLNYLLSFYCTSPLYTVSTSLLSCIFYSHHLSLISFLLHGLFPLPIFIFKLKISIFTFIQNLYPCMSAPHAYLPAP